MMKFPHLPLLALTAVISSLGQAASSTAKVAHDYPIQPVPFTAVHLEDQFWAPRIETNRSVTIPFAFKQCENSGRLYNFEAAAAALAGKPYQELKMPGFSFDDTDVYKVIEGASYSLSVKPDAALDKYIDGLIAKIAAAQEPDGYLYTARTMNPKAPHKWAGSERWVRERELSHELYNLGHLYEAAVAHYQATGKRSLLEIALRTADLLDKTFGPGKEAIWPGHQITEMGLAKLYRVTGDERYLKLAKFLLDVRGPDGHKGVSPYNQSHQPVVKQSEAVGHAVRAGYMYAGMADVAALTGDQAYVDAISRIWNDVVSTKLYLTGGIGARHEGEAFGGPYELPNESAYNETCAAIANVYWNHRLFLFQGDSAPVDVLERTLYNGVISGVSLDGKGFFYPNPLESAAGYQRQPWFGCACCPGNMTRFLASVSGYQYAHRDARVWVNLYAAGKARIELGTSGRLTLNQETRYPWDGDILLRIEEAPASELTLSLRIPGWARNEPVPSKLYRYLDTAKEQPSLSVNGKVETLALDHGYVSLKRSWKKGDVVKLQLPMSIRRVLANEAVAADRGRVALERGPIVYCLEGVDHPGTQVRKLRLSDKSQLRSEWAPKLLEGVMLIKGEALPENADKPVSFTAIPYATWANRGSTEMIVWLPRAE